MCMQSSSCSQKRVLMPAVVLERSHEGGAIQGRRCNTGMPRQPLRKWSTQYCSKRKRMAQSRAQGDMSRKGMLAYR